MRTSISFAVCLSLFAGLGLAGTNDLDVAREALRDGLWDIARAHAQRVNDDAARLIVLETHAREGHWRELLAAYDAMGCPMGEGFAYYRAAALFNEGEMASASNILANATFKDAALARSVARLRASLAVASGNLSGALSVLEKEGGSDVESKLLFASIAQRCGKNDAAAAAWRVVAADTNALDAARAEAAAGLGDKALLKDLVSQSQSATVRRSAELQLALLLLRDEETFAEGERLIRARVSDKPDADGAREAFLSLADALLVRGEWVKAEKAYTDVLGIWPDASKDASVHDGRGWAFFKIGRLEDAVFEFRSAETLAVEPERKASAAVKTADALSKSGQMQAAISAYRYVQTNYPGTKAAARVADVIRLREMEEKGRKLYREFAFDDARKIFDALAREDPLRRDQFVFCGALCAYGSGKDDAAEALAKKLMAEAKDVPVRAGATLWLAKLAFNRREWREAKRLFDAFVALSPASADAPRALAWSARAALSDNDFKAAIAVGVKLVSSYPDSPLRAAGLLVQGESLVELARFDEAVLVLDRVSLVSGVSETDRLEARVLRADALFAMGADAPSRYGAALDAYRAIRADESLSPGQDLSISFKIAKTLEKLKRVDEAIDVYYTHVVLAYRTGRIAGTCYDDAARATFARAAFRIADEYENRGRARQAVRVLDLVRTSDVQAAGEAANRMDRMIKKGLLP